MFTKGFGGRVALFLFIAVWITCIPEECWAFAMPKPEPAKMERQKRADVIQNQPLDEPARLTAEGDNYYYGLTVPRDYSKAFGCYSQAADVGYAPAQTNLAWMYYSGYGVPKDIDKAIELFSKAAEQGYGEACTAMGLVYLNVRNTPKYQTMALALEWLRKAADAGDLEGMYNLGLFYVNIAESDKWFKSAAERGHLKAQQALGIRYFDKGFRTIALLQLFNLDSSAGKLTVGQYFKQAAFWFRQAAEQGDAISQYYLGIMCYGDYPQGYMWLYLASEKGQEDAKKELTAITQKMTKAQIAEGNGLVTEWKKTHND